MPQRVRVFSASSWHDAPVMPSAKDKNAALRKIPQLRALIGNRTICFDLPPPRCHRACIEYEAKVVELHEAGYTPHMISLIVRRLRLAKVYQASIVACLKRNNLEPNAGRKYADFD
jgi:hypothetical protein